ncbi:MAG: YbaK/EbsC family protein [Spirochaetaceae bacterium]|jgi:prolyl-tRNA editing enzyme YbaK/EbsC (Cys-tRNA(Pro) deacylase)|nr:YbaK/EbsC family protein [Spirochaetaceae bacterium]
MGIEQVRDYLKRWGREQDIIELEASTATVAEAAAALGVAPARIAKSISLKNGEGALLVIAAGDVKLDNRKYKDHFGVKAKMLSAAEAPEMIGHAVGGVCPFALPEAVAVFLDVSMKRFATVFPACGSANSAIELTLRELEEYSQSQGWIDVCKAADGP